MRTGPIDNLLRSQGWAQGLLNRTHGCTWTPTKSSMVPLYLILECPASSLGGLPGHSLTSSFLKISFSKKIMHYNKSIFKFVIKFQPDIWNTSYFSITSNTLVFYNNFLKKLYKKWYHYFVARILSLCRKLMFLKNIMFNCTAVWPDYCWPGITSNE